MASDFLWLKWFWFKKGEPRPSSRIEAMLKVVSDEDRAFIDEVILQFGAEGILKGAEIKELTADKSTWTEIQRGHAITALTMEEWLYALGRSRMNEDRLFATAIRRKKRPPVVVVQKR
jgi:hypothetical protein